MMKEHDEQLRSASDAALIMDCSETTWRNLVKSDPAAPQPVAHDGRRALWRRDDVVNFARSNRRAKKSSRRRSRGSPSPRRCRFGANLTSSSVAKPYKYVQQLENPKAYATSLKDMTQFEVYPFASGEHGLFEFYADGTGRDTLVRFPAEREAMLEAFKAWVCENMPDDAEVRLYDKAAQIGELQAALG